LLDGLVARMGTSVGADACVVWLFEEATMRLLPRAAQGFSPGFFERVAHYTAAPGAFADLRRDQTPLYFPDLPAVIRRRDPAAADAYATEGIVSSLRLPLFAPGEQLIGLLALYHRRTRHYRDDEVRLAQAFADQIAVALQSVRLMEQERDARAAADRRLAQVTTLTSITRQLLAATELDTVLRVVVEAASRLCDASGAMVGLIDAERQHIDAVAAAGEPQAYFAHFRRPTLDDGFLSATATGQALAQRRAVAVDDYAAWGNRHTLQQGTVRLGVRAFVVAPLLVDGTPIGVLWVNDTRPRPFAAEDVALVEALADQAALAIEHTRLLTRSREAAALEERSRLARDLHDSVTQSVFSVGMLANAAHAQHARGHPATGATIGRIRAVAQEALSEMRALLYELHPAALAEEGLAKALAKLVAAMQVRTEVPLTFTGSATCRLSPDAETAMFRIVQEALGNALKYAQATAITVTLAETAEQLVASVTDDGVGFDPALHVAPSADGQRGGLGLRSMRARAAAAGMKLQIASTSEAGTCVTVAAPVPERCG
jgi:signal transduction histidine kinase